MNNDKFKPVTMTLTLHEFEKTVASLVKNEKTITACRILRKLGYSMDEAIAYYKGLPEYSDPNTKENQYLQSPYLCPECQSGNIESTEQVQVDYGAWQGIECGDCGTTWDDIYTLTGIDLGANS